MPAEGSADLLAGLRQGQDHERCQRRRENAPAGRSKIASDGWEGAAAGARHSFKQPHPGLSFPVRSNEPAFPSRPGILGHGAQRSGWEERSHAQRQSELNPIIA